MSKKQIDIESILIEALRRNNAEDRVAYLEATCGINTELRGEMDSLLHAYEDEKSLLEAPSDLLQEPVAPIAEAPGTVIDKYKLLEKIGEGGMAVVHMAEQEKPIRRKVALKIIKLGMDTKQVIARFEAERQALAMMDHPNVARVLDAGATDTGRPYFVMDLVPGLSITEYCNKNRLSIEERLMLFISVCNAVQHAHQKGIIHRDIKPSNIIVTRHDGQPVPKVIDFGIAKATNQQLTEKTLFTRYAHIIGTPAYMSPEQAELSDLDVDTRTDIYSLGILLYELLIGTTPFAEEQLREAGYLQMQKIICEAELTKPSTKLSTLGEALTDIAKWHNCSPESMLKLVRGDLDWIVMKSLDKDRTRRYETAHALAEDIERHLRDEPILAGAPSRIERCRKYIRRHRALITGVAAVLLVSLLGIIGMAVFAYKANRARDEALAVVHFLEEDIFGTLDPWRAQDVGVEELLDAANERIEAGTFKDKPLVEARVRQMAGATYHRLGVFNLAEHHLRLALKIFQKQHGEYDPDTLKTRLELGYLYFLWFRSKEAKSILVKALEGSRRVFGARHPLTLDVMYVLGGVSMHLGHQEADSLSTDCWEIARQELGAEHANTLKYACGLGVLRFHQNRWVEAERLLSEALKSPMKVGFYRFQFMLVLAMVYQKQNRLEQAEAQAQKAYNEAREALGPTHRESLFSMIVLASILAARGRSGDAEALLLDAVKIRQGNKATQPDWQEPRLALAICYARQGRWEEAERLLSEVLNDPNLKVGFHRFQSMRVLAIVYQKQNRLGQAEAQAQKACNEARETLGPAHRESLYSMIVLADVLAARGRSDDAETLLLNAVKISQENKTTQFVWMEFRVALARFYARQGRHDQMAEQITLYREEHPLIGKEGQSEWIKTLNGIAWILAVHPHEKVRNGPRAVEYAKEACVLSEWKDGRYIDTLAAAYAETGDFETAIQLEKQAIQVRREAVPGKRLTGFQKRLTLYESGKPYRAKK